MTNKVWLAALTVLTICLALPLGAAAQFCNSEAHDWVDAHTSELPRTYSEFSQFPLSYRRAIYSALTPEEQSGLWQEQFEKALLREDLTDIQRDVVLEAIQLATPELFASLKERDSTNRQEDRLRLTNFNKRAEAVFGKEGGGNLFARLGPADVEVGLILPREKSTIDLKIQAAAPGCSCSVDSDYCSSAFHCKAGDCIVIRDECGYLWTWDCDGQCVTNG